MNGCTAFFKYRIVAQGSPDAVVAALRALQAPEVASDLLIFDDVSGRQLDLGQIGGGALPATETCATNAPLEIPAPRGRGRPSLGVVSREVALLPRHWDWLARQGGGASGTLRRLVELAMKADDGAAARRDAAYRFLSAIAGDLPGFEEAARRMYAGNMAGFGAQAADWPGDIARHAAYLLGKQAE